MNRRGKSKWRKRSEMDKPGSGKLVASDCLGLFVSQSGLGDGGQKEGSHGVTENKRRGWGAIGQGGEVGVEWNGAGG